nr:helix-turn-helix domain-containing protein [Oceanusvirus sp.]
MHGDHSHQDWNTVVLRNPASRAKQKSAADAQRPKITDEAAHMAKLDRETDRLDHDRVSRATSQAIVTARTAKKLNRQKLATAVNLPVKVVEEYETGKAIPDGKVLQKLSRFLGVPLRK